MGYCPRIEPESDTFDHLATPVVLNRPRGLAHFTTDHGDLVVSHVEKNQPNYFPLPSHESAMPAIIRDFTLLPGLSRPSPV